MCVLKRQRLKQQMNPCTRVPMYPSLQFPSKKLAKIFGTDKIRMFSFYNAFGEEEKVYARLSEMVKLAAEEGVRLYHENEKDIYGDTLEHVLKIMKNVSGLHYIYDPANYVQVGENADDTIAALIGHTDYFHIKDVVADGGYMVPAGMGDGKIAKLLSCISSDTDTVLTLEPHLGLFKGYSDIDATELKTAKQYKDTHESFDAAANALKELLIQNGYKYNNGGYAK